MTRLHRLALITIILFGALVLLRCAPNQVQIQASAANAMAVSANAFLPVLIDQYRQEGVRAIDKATTREEAEAALAGVKKKWAAVWRAWAVLALAEDAWAKAIEADGDAFTAFLAVKKAYCGVQTVLPSDLPALPVSIIHCSK